MKKLSFILFVVVVISLVLSSCANSGNELLTTSGTKNIATTPTPSREVQEPTCLEPTTLEPIQVGMSYSEYLEACEEMKESYRGFLTLYRFAFWIDENGNHTVAELSVVDGASDSVVSIDRYLPRATEKKDFDSINEAEAMTMQELVELVGIPYNIDLNHNSFPMTYVDINLVQYEVIYEQTHISVETKTSIAQNGLDSLKAVLSDKYSLDDFDVHRVFVREKEDDKYEMCLQGVYGEEKTFWSKSFDISEYEYQNYSNFRNVKDGVLYNVVKTEEYGELYYSVQPNLFATLAVWLTEK